MDPIAERNLQALPTEVLDMILLKAVSKRLQMMRREFNCFICPIWFNQEIESLRTVWSEWNYRLTTRWFWIKLKRLSRLTFTRLQKRIHMKHHVKGIVKLKDSICVLSQQPNALRVYKIMGNFSLEREVPLDDSLLYSRKIEPSAKSNSVYVQHTSVRGLTIQKAYIDEDEAVTIWLEDIQSRRYPAITVTNSDNVFLLMNDRVYLYSAEAELLKCVEIKKHSVLKPSKILHLPQGNFVIGFAHVRSHKFIGILGEILCEGATIKGGVAREDAGMILWDSQDQLWDNFIGSMPSTPERKHISVDIKNRLMFMISKNSNNLLVYDTTSLILVQSIPLPDECSGIEVTEDSTEGMPGPPLDVEGLCYDPEKRALYVGNPLEETIDVFKVY